MTFYHGKNTTVVLNGIDLSTYFDSVDLSADADVAETSTFKGNWKKNLAGMTSVKVDTSGLYDPTQMNLPPLLGAEAGALLYIGMPDGATSRLVRLISTAYAESSAVGGAVAFKWSVLSDNAVIFGNTLHALGAEASGGTGGHIDLGTAAVGATAQMHYTAASSLAVVIEDASVPTGGGSNWATVTGGTFATVSSAGAQRIHIPGTVRRYVRVTWTGSGTFSVAIARD